MGATQRSAFGIPFTVCRVVPGFNRISLNARSVGRKFTVDGFAITAADIPKQVSEKYRPNSITTNYEEAGYTGPAVFRKGIDVHRVTPGAIHPIGDITSPPIDLPMPRAYAFYLQLNDGVTKLHFGHRNELGYAPAPLYTVEFTALGGIVDARLYMNLRDGTRFLLSETLDLANGYPIPLGPGTSVRMLFDVRATVNTTQLLLAHGTTKQICQVLSSAMPDSTLLVENATAVDVYTTGVTSFIPPYAFGSGGGLPVDGESYYDVLNSSKVTALGGVFKSQAYL